MNEYAGKKRTPEEIKAAIDAYKEAGKRGVIGILAWYLSVPEEDVYRVAGKGDRAEYDAVVTGCER